VAYPVRAVVRLQRDSGLAIDAGDYLEEVLGRFTEGFDTADFQEAQALCRQ